MDHQLKRCCNVKLLPMPIRTYKYSRLSAFFVILCGVGALSLGVASADAGEAGVVQWVSEADRALRASGSGAMVVFASLYGRGCFEMADRLAMFDRVLWLFVLIGGVGACGVLLTADRWPPVALLWCALGLACVMALAAWRCRVGRVAGGGVFATGAVCMMLGPGWFMLSGAEVASAEATSAATAIGMLIGLLVLCVSLLLAIVRQPVKAKSGEHGVQAAAGVHEESTHRPPEGPVDGLQDGRVERGGGAPSSACSLLATPRMFHERLERGMQRSARSSMMLAVLWVDVRSAQEVERLFGDTAGQELLMSVSRRLDEVLRLESTLVRIGKHSFAAVCEAVTDFDEVLAIISKLRERLALPCELSDGEIRIDASFGHALFPQDGADAQTLCRAAARRARGAVRRDALGSHRNLAVSVLDGYGLPS